MLLEAKILLRNGVDVKIGYVETHGRKETHELLEGLPAIARKHGTAAEGSGDTILMRLRKKP
ncbi:hypothetical protein [Puia sp.]|uniref:hypothetical protein n=1 Tax=Puia sp. TaxID=2045100 RepID=UPI002D80EA88|nr:hypothetical protein [Puia sp.]